MTYDDFDCGHCDTLRSELSELEEQAQALVSALRKVRDRETCEALYPGCEKYNSFEYAWHGVSEFARQALEAYEAWKRGKSE